MVRWQKFHKSRHDRTWWGNEFLELTGGRVSRMPLASANNGLRPFRNNGLESNRGRYRTSFLGHLWPADNYVLLDEMQVLSATDHAIRGGSRGQMGRSRPLKPKKETLFTMILYNSENSIRDKAILSSIVFSQQCCEVLYTSSLLQRLDSSSLQKNESERLKWIKMSILFLWRWESVTVTYNVWN